MIFSSDNGFHMGQRRLMEGKQGAWDHDIRVPLVVAGPGVLRGRDGRQLAANVDLRPTFEELAGAPVGRRASRAAASPACCASGFEPSWRDVTLIEHHGPDRATAIPTSRTTSPASRRATTALRFADALYVEYDNPERPPEYYDLAATRSSSATSTVAAAGAQGASSRRGSRACARAWRRDLPGGRPGA